MTPGKQNSELARRYSVRRNPAALHQLQYSTVLPFQLPASVNRHKPFFGLYAVKRAPASENERKSPQSSHSHPGTFHSSRSQAAATSKSDYPTALPFQLLASVNRHKTFFGLYELKQAIQFPDRDRDNEDKMTNDS
jgi:hypothetical protein